MLELVKSAFDAETYLANAGPGRRIVRASGMEASQPYAFSPSYSLAHTCQAFADGYNFPTTSACHRNCSDGERHR